MNENIKKTTSKFNIDYKRKFLFKSSTAPIGITMNRLLKIVNGLSHFFDDKKINLVLKDEEIINICKNDETGDNAFSYFNALSLKELALLDNSEMEPYLDDLRKITKLKSEIAIYLQPIY